MQDKIHEIRQLINLFEQEYNKYVDPKKGLNEQNTRQQYIDQLLKQLGWDINNSKGLSYYNREIVAEEYESNRGRPDYTIKQNGVSKFHVEAKKVSIPIMSDKKSAFQIRSYGWNSKHKIGVLTNFEYLIIYSTYKMPSETDSFSEDRYKVFHYSEYVEKFKEIYDLLSRESVVNGRFDEWTNEISPDKATKLSLDNIFLEQLNFWRIEISNDLLKTNKPVFENEKYTNEIVQNFLNQLIFLRFAEDNGYEKNSTLKNLPSHCSNYTDFLKCLDQKYNAGIFKENTIINNLSKNLLEEIVEKLYYPKVSYDFSIIELSLLSKVYENFLQKELTLKNYKYELTMTNYAKVKSVVSTPEEIVKIMVEKSLDPIFRNNITPKEILKLNIADLAVGSGVFLIGVYDYIEKYLMDWYAHQKNEAPNAFIVPFKLKKEIITKVLHGYDVNKQAADLTRFSLLLRVLKNEHKERILQDKPLLPSLKENILHGNSLITTDDIKFDQIQDEDLYIISPMEKKKEHGDKFDVIIGNPPYLNTEDMKKATPPIEFEIYKKKFSFSFKQFDKYFLFVEKSLDLVKDKGQVTLLIPNKFFNVGSAIKMREHIMENNSLHEIIDFGYNQIFDGVINYVAIVNFSHFDKGNFIYRRANNVGGINHSERLEYDLNDMKDSHWFLTTDKEWLELFNIAMSQFPNILNSIRAYNGIQTSKTKVYYIPKSDVLKEHEQHITFGKKVFGETKKFTIEKDLLKELYAPGKKTAKKAYDLMIPNNYVIFPYEFGKVIKEDKMKKLYPKTYSYLSYFKGDLLPKALGGQRDVKNGNLGELTWYEYGRSQYLKESQLDKILGVVLSKTSNFSIDRNQLLNATGGTAGVMSITMRKDTKYSLEYILAWLNHPFVDAIFKTIGSNFEGGYYTHGTALYKDIPLLPINFDNKNENELHEKIKSLVHDIEEINKEEGKPNNAHKKEIYILKKEKLIKSINNLIYNQLLKKKDEYNEA